MDIGEVIRSRRTVRAYTEKEVDRETILLLIDAAIQAPSAVNQQPWTFTVLRDQSLLEQISNKAKAQMLTTLPTDTHSNHMQVLLNDPDFHIFYHAPVLILISANADSSWATEDCALAAENLMLTAYANGLGSGWIGFAQSFLKTDEGKHLLNIPAAWVPVAPIIVGYPKVIPQEVPRKKPEIMWADKV